MNEKTTMKTYFSPEFRIVAVKDDVITASGVKLTWDTTKWGETWDYTEEDN